jgi:hypothetical protein
VQAPAPSRFNPILGLQKPTESEESESEIDETEEEVDEKQSFPAGNASPSLERRSSSDNSELDLSFDAVHISPPASNQVGL